MALSLAGAPIAHAQSREGDSDDYICNHGAPDDPTTIEACNRLRGTARGAGVESAASTIRTTTIVTTAIRTIRRP
ncbi:MAG: hypothetical protein WDM85_17200 [Caulobacteraceae bacterium]